MRTRRVVDYFERSTKFEDCEPDEQSRPGWCVHPRPRRTRKFCGAFSKATASPKLFRFIKTSEKDYAFPTRTRRSALRNRVRGSPAREGFSLKRSRKAHFFLLELYFGSCCARQLKQERFSAVKSSPISVSRASLIFLCSAQRENMEFRLAGQNDRHFLNPFSGFENR